MQNHKTTLGKALEINQDEKIYGAFAEIGAGQEVARFFFQAGQASQTIAKTMSAYDMIYSDEIYGKEKSGRYVCESRVIKMLDKEYSLLQKRLNESRGDKTTFFAYANTVATGDQKKRFSHGWMGVRFQTKPNGEFNDIVLHLRMMDKYRLIQQETLGVLGVNLVHAAFRHLKNPREFISHLVDTIKDGQVLIDFIRFSGPDLKSFNNKLLNLELVRKGLADAVLFDPQEEILSISDAVFKKPLVIQRGSYRPVTNSHLDVLEKGLVEFKRDFKSSAQDALVIFELPMHSFEEGDKIDEQDFLDRVRCLCALGQHVLVTNFSLYYKLKRFFRQYTTAPLVLIINASHLDKLFAKKHYADLEGGLMEGLGKLLDDETKVYVYPHKVKDSCQTAKSFHPSAEIQKIYDHYLANKQIMDISNCDQTSDFLHSEDVRKLMLKRDKNWEKLVPKKVRELIVKDKLFRMD